MLCPDCRRQVTRGAPFCGSCGAPLARGEAPLELVLAGGERVPLVEDVVIGRSPGSTIQLDDPSVSRTHARISVGDGRIEDAGSSHGTFVDGAMLAGPLALRDGMLIRIGDQELKVERRRDSAEAGRTIVVRPGASLVVGAVGASAGVAGQATQFGMKPRMRSGYALKRLDADEGARRWVLRDLSRDGYLRLSDKDAQLLELLDGTRSLVDLIGEAEQRFGASGPARLARLLADLGERGFLAGVASTQAGAEAEPSFLRRVMTPREKVFEGVGAWFDRLYRRGGWVLFTRPALWAIAALCVVGIGVFAALVALRYGTPFVVANKIGLGGLVFLLGRFAVVAVHETAHGLTMSSFGRRVEKAGLKLVVIFPFAYVDTSQAWFEPRRRRIAISAAGPVSPTSPSARSSRSAASRCPRARCATSSSSSPSPAMSARSSTSTRSSSATATTCSSTGCASPGCGGARASSSRGGCRAGAARTTRRCSRATPLWGIVWLVLAGGFVIVMSLRYEPIMTALLPDWVVHVVMGTLWVAVFIPVLFVVGKPLLDRLRGRVGT